MDLCLLGFNQEAPAEEVAEHIGLTADQVRRIYRDIEAKRRVAKYLHSPPLLVVE
jgi:NAD+ synthase